MPMLAVVLTSAPCLRLNGRVKESSTRAATLAASSGRSSRRQHQHKLVSAQPGKRSPSTQLWRAQQDVGLAHAGADALGDASEQHVADVMPVRVVDVLEVVQVQGQDRRQALRTAGARCPRPAAP